MKEFWNTEQLVFTAVGGWLGYFLGGCDGLLIALVVFAAVDYITGLMCAISDQKPSSEGVSLLENAAYLSLPVPKKLEDVLAQLHDRRRKAARTNEAR